SEIIGNSTAHQAATATATRTPPARWSRARPSTSSGSRPVVVVVVVVVLMARGLPARRGTAGWVRVRTGRHASCAGPPFPGSAQPDQAVRQWVCGQSCRPPAVAVVVAVAGRPGDRGAGLGEHVG